MNTILLGGSLLFLCSGLTRAATVSWGNAHETQNYSSDATPLETGSPGSVMFELGIFETPGGSEFTPTFENRADWQANWKPFTGGVSDYNNPVAGRGAAATEENTFTGLVTFSDDAFTAGRQVYIWGFNQKAETDGGGTFSEWVLFTGTDNSSPDTNWVIPNGNGQGQPTRTWDVFNANSAIVGKIPDSTGDGEMTDPGALSFDDLQFATIPEPSAMLLSLLSGVMILRRKRSL